MIKVGITGLMGSGKSYISSLFEELGVPLYNSDERARWVNNNNTFLKNKLIDEFGDNIYSNGELNKDKLRQIVFVNGGEERLKKLNQIVHPYIFQDFNDFCSKNSNKPMILAESAILFESKMNTYLDKIIFVNVPYDIRLERTIKRDGITKEEYDNRMKGQISPEEKIKISDFVLDNTNLSAQEAKNIVNIFYNILVGR
jgi:dephospho-CoA kinase